MTPDITIPAQSFGDKTAMLTTRRAALALTLLALAAILCLVGSRLGTLAAPHVDVTTLPSSFGPWVMTGSERTDPKNLALDDATAKSLDLDSYTNRNYINRSTGQQIQMLIEYRRLGRGAFNHRPEACYPASGYTLTGRHTTPITYGGSAASAITCVADYHGHLGVSHQVLLYWFGTGNHTETNFFWQQVEMAFGRLQPKKNGWVFVRLIDECRPDTDAASLAAEKDFTAQASPAIIQTISAPS
jgi:EpsI family protein